VSAVGPVVDVGAVGSVVVRGSVGVVVGSAADLSHLLGFINPKNTKKIKRKACII
jgi:hypothetical protein